VKKKNALQNNTKRRKEERIWQTLIELGAAVKGMATAQPNAESVALVRAARRLASRLPRTGGS